MARTWYVDVILYNRVKVEWLAAVSTILTTDRPWRGGSCFAGMTCIYRLPYRTRAHAADAEFLSTHGSGGGGGRSWHVYPPAGQTPVSMD